MAGCRDCSRCIETGMTGIIMGIPRVIWTILTCWNIGLFQKNCPQCGHRMSTHKMTKDGKFVD